MTSSPSSFLFRNGRVLDLRRGVLLEGHELLVEDGTVREVSPTRIESRTAQVIDLAGRTLMPGLIDCHVHTMFSMLNLGALNDLPQVTQTLRALPILAGMLRRGFTTVRDAGGAGHALKVAIDEGLAPGPRLFVSGPALSPTGGHGDFRPRSDFLRPVAGACICGARHGSTRVADGVDEVRRAARELLQMGADQIKIMAGGGVASPTDPIDALGYSEDETRAIVDEAAARNTYVLAHAYTPAAIQRAVRCGVRTIEHGNLIDEPTARLMADQGCYAVPTLVTYEALASEGARLGLPDAAIAKLGAVRDAGLRSLDILARARVAIGFGTDLLGESHRLQSDEFRIRAQVQSNADVLRSATIVGAEILRMPGRLGELVAGAIADLLVVDGDPLADLACLAGQGERIGLVMKGGAICFFDRWF